MSKTVRVNYGNVYYKNRRLRRAKSVLRRGAPHFIVVAEGGKTKRIRGYRPYEDPYGRDEGRTDVRIFARKGVHHQGLITIQLQPSMPRFPAAHERFAVAALGWVAGVGKVAVIGIHPTPGPRALRGDGSHVLAISYDLAMKRLAELMVFLKELGYLTVVAGDVQLPAGAAKGRSWDPYAVLPKSGLHVAVTEHLDLIAVDDNLECLEAKVMEHKHSPATGSDHPFLTITARRRRRMQP